MYEEPKITYNFTWKIERELGNLDVSYDAYKPYWGKDLTKVHIDNNIVQKNNYYRVKFLVFGFDKYYTGMTAELTHRIYLGEPPLPGKCNIDLN
jgi:hypothetical protein